LVAASVLAADGAFRFTRVTQEAAVDFVHTDGRTGALYFVETIGSGAAFVDYDNDGWLDIYLVNAGESPHAPDRNPDSGKNRLYRNNRDGSFSDVTDRAGVGHTGYGTGVCAADFDNDGWTDLFVTNYGATVLYRNSGDGTFSDVAERAGVSDRRWSAGAAFGDIDRDGDLDLYVAFYCKWDLTIHHVCHEQGVEIYCGPEEFTGDADRLFRNNGDGTFTDITRESGVYDPDGKGLGVVFADYDDDGDLDIYVANDGTPNNLYRNRGDGNFEDVAWFAGVDADDAGNAQGSMGIAVGDYDRDGRLDIGVTNFQRQYNTIYRNDGGGFFADVSFPAGMGASLPLVSWGAAFFDADSDGWLDLFIANGHIQERVGEYDPTTSYAQRNSLYQNLRDGAFRDVTAESADGMRIVKVSRGVAFGDYDNDGDVDILVSNANDTPDLLRNDSPQGNWLLVGLVGVQSNRGAIGARVTAFLDSGRLVAEVRSGDSYLSQNDLRVHFGLGAETSVRRLEVRWPSGVVDVVEDAPAGQVLRIAEGETRAR
jgi:hypothetical protein